MAFLQIKIFLPFLSGTKEEGGGGKRKKKSFRPHSLGKGRGKKSRAKRPSRNSHFKQGRKKGGKKGEGENRIRPKTQTRSKPSPAGV